MLHPMAGHQQPLCCWLMGCLSAHYLQKTGGVVVSLRKHFEKTKKRTNKRMTVEVTSGGQ
jgi:hypothetical protein